MIPEIRQIKMNLTLFEQGLEEFMKKAEQVKNDNIELAKENDSLKKRIAEELLHMNIAKAHEEMAKLIKTERRQREDEH